MVRQAYAQGYVEFVENKGQWQNDIQFRGDLQAGAIALTPTGYKMLRYNTEDLEAIHHFYHPQQQDAATNAAAKEASAAPSSLRLRGHMYEAKFLNANPNPTVIPEKPQVSYNNYFLGKDPSKWASGCKLYTAVTYKNIYPNIDVRYYTGGGNLKYDIVVHPGGDPSRIALYFDGIDGLKVKNEELLIKTSVDEVKERKPYTYALSQAGKKKVPCSFDVKGNIVRFKMLASVPADATLVIDPTLIFATFTGSSADNWGYTATYDADGNFYAGGIVFGAGFLTTTGAFDLSFNGGVNTGESPVGFDIGIMKFNPTGSQSVYATYIGGDGNEQPHSLVVDNAGNLVISGRTSSTSYPVFPAGTPVYGSGGGWDIILTKLNASGTALIGSRIIGGTNDDGVNIRHKYATDPPGATSIRRNYGDDARSEVIVDDNGLVYLASCTQSADFPTTAGAAQTVPGAATPARYQDAVIIKTSPDLSNIIFSTLLGGDGDDAAFVLALNPTDQNIYIAGGTTSTNLPGNRTGVIFPNNQGTPSNESAVDGFITVLNNNGTQFIRSTYMGTNGIDVVYGIQFDKFSFPYVMGTTTGNWPVVNAAFSQAGGKQFISKLKKDLSGWEYSTVFGTNRSIPNISPIAFLVDRCENVYVSGWGGQITSNYPALSTQAMTVTPDATQNTTDGKDFYFFVLERNAVKQLYGSFFGESGGISDHVDGGTSRFDKNGVIYQSMCANCGGASSGVFPTTPGAYKEKNGSSNCNLAAIKIAFNLAGVGSDIRSSIQGSSRDTSGCVPLTVSFRDVLAQGKRFIWDFGDGHTAVTTVPFAENTYNNIGTYTVKLISIDSASCNIADSSTTTITVRNDDATVAASFKKVGNCSSYTIDFFNNSLPPQHVNKPFKANSFTWDFGDGSPKVIAGINTVQHTYPGEGTYHVKLILTDTNYCNAPDTFNLEVRLALNVKAKFDEIPSGCVPFTAVFNNTSLGGTSFQWSFGDGGTSKDTHPQYVFSTAGTYTIQLVANDPSTCNLTDTFRSTIVISPNPTASFTYSPNPPQENTPVRFTNTSTGATSFEWQFGDGETLTTTSMALVSHVYNETKTYNACLIAGNVYGCKDTTCKSFAAKVSPLLDVPKAFSPNNDGVNEKIYVRGYGIAKMKWVIYNRWGTQVFITANRNEGWDGRYNGVLQPQEVYTYTLEVEFTDGSKYARKGDITLLR
jgi:gliding motility-associated-like protein